MTGRSDSPLGGSPPVIQGMGGSEPQASPKQILWGCLVLTAITVAVYFPVGRYGFVNYDDSLYVTEAPQVLRGLTWGGLRWAFTSGYAANWHPLTWLSLMLDVRLFGPNPGAFHLVNLFFHVANTLLLFTLLCRATGAAGRSGFVAALFATHPLHVESVAWIAERKDVLSALFFLLTLGAYVAYVRQGRWWRCVWMLILFALGLMTKPMLVTLPLVLLLLDVWPLGRVPQFRPSTWGPLLWEKIPLFALSIASCAVTMAVQRREGAVPSLDQLPLRLRLENAVAAYARYAGKTVWPAHLAVFYPYPRHISPWWILGGASLLLGVSAAVLSARRHRYLAVGWFWFLGTLVPVIGIVQVGNQSMADRYTYIPLIGLFIMAAWGGTDLFPQWRYRRAALVVLACGITAACAIAGRRQVDVWQNSQALWTHALDSTTGNYVAHNLLGFALAEQGEADAAIAHYSQALLLKPTYADAHYNLGVALTSQGRVGDAMAQYSEALRIDPGDVKAHNNLAILLGSQGRTEEAIAHYSEALQIDPDYAPARNNLGVALASQGRFPEAIAEYEAFLRQQPNSAEVHNNLANALVHAGRSAEAISQYQEALRVKPDYADAHLNLGLTLASRGDTQGAARELSAVLRIRPYDAKARGALSRLAGLPSPAQPPAGH